MKRIGLILIVLVLTPVVSVGALFFMPGPGGEPMMNMEMLRESLSGDGSMFQKLKVLSQKAREKAKSLGKKTSQYLTSTDTERIDAPVETPQETLFKWRGEDGKWHYSNQLPQDREVFEVVSQE